MTAVESVRRYYVDLGQALDDPEINAPTACVLASDHDAVVATLEQTRLKLQQDVIDKDTEIATLTQRVERAEARVELLERENAWLVDALEIVRPHVDIGQARLNGSYCVAKIDEHTFCGRGRRWPGHRADAKEWPEHEFIDGAALITALTPAGEKA